MRGFIDKALFFKSDDPVIKLLGMLTWISIISAISAIIVLIGMVG